MITLRALLFLCLAVAPAWAQVSITQTNPVVTGGACAPGTFATTIAASTATPTCTAAGDVSKVGTPSDDQIAVWTGSGTIEGTASLTYATGTGITATGGYRTLSSGTGVSAATSDAADTAAVVVAGGGASGSSRGAYLSLFGNEHASAGDADLQIGNVAGSAFTVYRASGTAALEVAGADGSADFTSSLVYTNGAAWNFDSTATDGNYLRLATSGTNMGIIGSLRSVLATGTATDLIVYTPNLLHIQGGTWPTTASAGNVYTLNGGPLMRSTSSLKVKQDIHSLSLRDARRALRLRPIVFRSAIATDDPTRIYWGFGAEEAAATYLPFSDNGRGDATNYDMRAIVAALTRIIQDQEARIHALEAR